jgi:hypothetical protein
LCGFPLLLIEKAELVQFAVKKREGIERREKKYITTTIAAKACTLAEPVYH